MTKKKPMTRKEAIAVAQNARKIPMGRNSQRVYLQVSAAIGDQLQNQTPTERGRTYSLGSELEAHDHLLLRQILGALGSPVSLIVVSEGIVKIKVGDEIYRGVDQTELLLTALKTALEKR